MISGGTAASDARNTAADMKVRSTSPDMNVRGTAADAKARGTATDLKVRGTTAEAKKNGTAADSASAAALQLASRGRKVTAKGDGPRSGSPGHKGPASFVHLLTAKLAGKDHQVPLKDLLPVDNPSAVSKTAEGGTRKLVPQLAVAHSAEEKKVVAGNEEADAKKRPSRAPAGSAHTAAQMALALAPAPSGQLMPRAEKSAQVKEPVAASGNTHGAHPGTPGAAQPQAAEPRIHVVDLRRKAEAGRTAEDAAAPLKNQQGLSADKDATASLSPRAVTFQDGSGSPAFKQSSPVVPAGQTALERFREMAGNELVKATNMVLRDGGGEIRLVLKPESLGSVRIKMHLVDNTIEGKIVVDNQAVKQVIDGNLDSLMRALRAEGFQGATLQVSVGGQNADNGRQAQEERPEAVRRVTAQGFERNIPGVENLSMGDLLVNLFV